MELLDINETVDAVSRWIAEIMDHTVLRRVLFLEATQWTGDEVIEWW